MVEMTLLFVSVKKTTDTLLRRYDIDLPTDTLLCRYDIDFF